jgi:hypothetical protein
MLVRRLIAGVVVAFSSIVTPILQAQCSGDVNGDGIVGAEDLAAVLFAWGPCKSCEADIDLTGFVDAADISTVVGAWGICPPSINVVTPSFGQLAGGMTVTIAGANFWSPVSVLIGGAAASSVNVVSTTQLTAVTPAGAAGPASVSVTTPGGTASLANGFTYLAAPSIASVMPNSGPTSGGTAITITGTNLIGTSSITVGDAAATSVSVENSTTVTAVTTAGKAGAGNVVVTTPGGTATSMNAFTYLSYPAPTVTEVSPNPGPASGGTTVTIMGTDFWPPVSVSIGGLAGR